MALAPIHCAKGKHRISPSTALKEVNGEIWCEDCVSKSIEGTRLESNPCAEVGNYYKSMNLDLEKAKWVLRFKAHGPIIINGIESKGIPRFSTFSIESYIWTVPFQYRIEIFENGNWKLWKYRPDSVQWQFETEGTAATWAANWQWLDANLSPK